SMSQDKLKKLKDKLKRAEEEKMTDLEDFARAKADFLNASSRLDEVRIADRERTKLGFVEDLLPICDSYSMALSDPAFEALSENLKKGIFGINLQLASVLKGHNVEEVGKVGDKFDPAQHEALADDGDGNEITDVLQKGYKMG